jgi:DNA-binding PucR family transcriptional regulator
MFFSMSLIEFKVHTFGTVGLIRLKVPRGFSDQLRSQRAVRRRASRDEFVRKEIQHPDAVLYFTQVSEDSTKLTKAETSSESTPSVILK